MTEPGNLEKLQQLSDELTDPELDPELAVALFEHSPDAIVITDSKGKIRRFNIQAELMFGYPRAEVWGRHVEMLVPVVHREAHMLHRSAFWTDPRTRPMGLGRVLFAIRKDGEEFEAEINLSPTTTRHGRFVIATVRKAR